MDYYRLGTGEMLAGRRISVCFLVAIFHNILFVPRCHGNLVFSYTFKRCWSDVENTVTTTHTNASTTCFTKNSEDVICYELKSDVFTCKPPWEVVSVTDPATLDHLAVAMKKSTFSFFPARISGDLATNDFFNYFLNGSECSSKTVVNGDEIQKGSCGLLSVFETYYDAQFVSESCQQFENDMYACSKTLAIGGLDYSTTVQSSTPTSTLLKTGGLTTDSSLVIPGSAVGNLDMLHIILLAVSINLLVVILIISIVCCCCKRKSKKRSTLLNGSFRNSNRPLPIPVSEKYNQDDREYAYPTVAFFSTTDNNGLEETDTAVRTCASTPPGVPTRQYDTDDDIQYMHIGETVIEHQQALMQRQRQAKHPPVHSYLELEDLPPNDGSYQRPITHTYADLNNPTRRSEEEYYQTGAQTKFKQNDMDKPQSCYMGLSNATRSNMDVSVYKGLRHGHLVKSGCTREGCEECESAHLSPNSRYEMDDHESANTAHDVITETPQLPYYQESLIMEPDFYMAVEGRAQGSCEIGDMAKCFEDNTYSFLK